jgi:hypothetical protein
MMRCTPEADPGGAPGAPLKIEKKMMVPERENGNNDLQNTD